MAKFKKQEELKEGLVDLQMYTDEIYGETRYFLKAVYRRVTPHKVEEVTIPKIELPVNHKDFELDVSYFNPSVICEYSTIDIGFGKLPIYKDDNGTYATCRVIEERAEKMTLSEIEKKLGYKIELVSEK